MYLISGLDFKHMPIYLQICVCEWGQISNCFLTLIDRMFFSVELWLSVGQRSIDCQSIIILFYVYDFCHIAREWNKSLTYEECLDWRTKKLHFPSFFVRLTKWHQDSLYSNRRNSFINFPYTPYDHTICVWERKLLFLAQFFFHS